MVSTVKLGGYIEKLNRPNSELVYGIDDVCGITNTKQITLGTKANLIGRTFEKFTILKPREFIFNRRTSRNGERISLGFNESDRDWILTEDYCHFKIREDKENELLPEYLYLFFLNPEFDRYARFNSWGSATEFFNWEEMIEVPIHIPSIEEQRKIVHDYKVVTDRIELLKKINENLEETAIAIFNEDFGGVDVHDAKTTVPEHCSIVSADSHFSITIGKTPPREDEACFTSDETDYIWVSIADMKEANPYILHSKEHLTEDAVNENNVKLVPANSILVSFKMTVGRVAIADRILTTNEAIAHFPCTEDELPYMYCMLSTYNYDKLGSTSSITTAINSKIIKAMPILMPDTMLLKAFKAKTLSIFNSMKNNASEIVALEKLQATIIAGISRERR